MHFLAFFYEIRLHILKQYHLYSSGRTIFPAWFLWEKVRIKHDLTNAAQNPMRSLQ